MACPSIEFIFLSQLFQPKRKDRERVVVSIAPCQQPRRPDAKREASSVNSSLRDKMVFTRGPSGGSLQCPLSAALARMTTPSPITTNQVKFSQLTLLFALPLLPIRLVASHFFLLPYLSLSHYPVSQVRSKEIHSVFFSAMTRPFSSYVAVGRLSCIK